MTGLEKITSQILEAGKSQGEEILKDAQTNADKIIAEAEAEAAKIKAASDEKVKAEKASAESRAKSSADLKKRQAVLLAKQEIITDIIAKAKAKLLALSDDEYFAMMEKLVAKSASAKSGQISFNAKDLARMPKDFEAKIASLAKANGGELALSKDAANIDGGFVLIYGGIEENCSIDAMFNANKEDMADKVNSLLFGR